MADQTDKPKLGTRPPLGLKRTVETGKVKQSFSHGRSNTVVVEVKKRRILGRPGEAPPAEAPKPEPVAEAPKPAPKPAAPAPQPKRTSPVDDITARKEMQARLLREAEEARLTSLEEARRRDDRAKRRAERRERRRAEENRKAEEAAAERGSPEGRGRDRARRGGSGRGRKPRARRPSKTKTALPADRWRPCAGPKRPEPARPSRGRGDDRRHSGKLTVTRALVRRGRQPRPLARRASPRPREGKARPPAGRPGRQAVSATSTFPRRSPSRNSPSAWASAAPTWSRRCSRWARPSRSPRRSTRTPPSC